MATGEDERRDATGPPCSWCGYRRALLVVDGVATCALCQSANPYEERTRAAAETILTGFWDDE
ncbi:MAG: hypothetical protein S0880_00940 [Actinomycetota bacterium]|nr:hypothetical protein [Actinomycetota bacterium]